MGAFVCLGVHWCCFVCLSTSIIHCFIRQIQLIDWLIIDYSTKPANFDVITKLHVMNSSWYWHYFINPVLHQLSNILSKLAELCSRGSKNWIYRLPSKPSSSTLFVSFLFFLWVHCCHSSAVAIGDPRVPRHYSQPSVQLRTDHK